MASTLWQPGNVLEGRYELIQLVGEGGMGVVWRVFDREWDRDLALKLPRQVVLDNQVLRERYIREAETWIGLGVHPHIVQCWFVTEIFSVPALFLDYLTGGSLASWMEEGHVRPGAWGLILEIVMQVAEGLAYAHSMGVVHRDVKPENLLIRGDERVCVTDFGLVKTAVTESELNPGGPIEGAAGTTFAAGVTCAGAFLGTPRYAAPEQWGAAERVGPSADIYALGVVLYELCAGRRPFDDDEEDPSPMDIIRRHLEQPAPDPREFNPEMPADLAQLCLLTLEKEPARRPPDMLALRELLHSIYTSVTGQTYRPAVPLLGAQSPDVLNNQAFSLHSLGKTGEAVQTLRRGLSLDPGHPECLYNLVQLEKRSGHIGQSEALRRVEQARAYYPLALLQIEHGLPEQALASLQDVEPDQLSSPGLHHRARGDALMYLGHFAEAERAYSQAQVHMPKDALADYRRRLAGAGRGQVRGGHIYFPSSRPIHAEAGLDSGLRVLLEDHGEGVIVLTQETVRHRSFDPHQLEVRVSRCAGAGRVSQAWLSTNRLAIADSRGFELRDFPSLELITRGEGELLACSPGVEYLITHGAAGLGLFTVTRNQYQPIGCEDRAHGPVLTAFDRAGQSLGLLLPSGQLATLDQDGNTVPEPWPDRVEGHLEAKCMALFDQDTILIGLASGTIRSYDLMEQEVEFSLELGEVPRSLEICGAQSRIIVRTIRGNFFLLDRAGRILLSGFGPLAVSPDDQMVLVVCEGRPILYNLNPFYELRYWPESAACKGAKSVVFSRDGRLAAVASVPGAFSVWEIDESHRVYQRELLMSPGRGYSDILSAHERFQRQLGQAHEALGRGDPLASLRHLQRARRVAGYGHGGPAQDFAWQLLKTLRRDRLEAVWERLSLSGSNPQDIDVHPEGYQLLYAFGQQATLALDQHGAASVVWTISRPRPIRLLRFVRGYVLIVDDGGYAALHESSDGQVLHEYSLKKDSLSRAVLHDSSVIYQSQDGSVGVFNLSEGDHTGREFKPSYVRLFAPWSGAKILATTEDSLGILDLSQPGSEMEPLRLGLAITKVPCFLEHISERGLLVLSFTSGTLRVLDVGGGGVLCALAHGEGNIVTAFQLLPDLGVAITTTANGHIIFWDLRAEQPLGEFVAHRGAITCLRAGRSGRDLLTCGEDGLVRCWETSWSAGAARDSESEVSWLSKAKPAAGLSRFLRGTFSTH